MALEPVFKRAQEAGIKVLTHESPDQKFNDWNVELTSVQGFGETHMEALAKAMGGEGKYIVYVGSLTVPLHNKWADAAIALQKEKYPKMQLVADRFGVAESMDDSYKTALDQMRANPDLKGILAFGSQGPIGAARARRGARQGEEPSRVVGPFSPGQGAKYIKSGAIREGFIWNPMLAGEVIVYVGNMLAKGETPTDGMDMPGLGPVTVDAATRNIHGAEARRRSTRTPSTSWSAWASDRSGGARRTALPPRMEPTAPFLRLTGASASASAACWRSTASTGT